MQRFMLLTLKDECYKIDHSNISQTFRSQIIKEEIVTPVRGSEKKNIEEFSFKDGQKPPISKLRFVVFFAFYLICGPLF